jgi:hypothetical protein
VATVPTEKATTVEVFIGAALADRYPDVMVVAGFTDGDLLLGVVTKLGRTIFDTP